MSRENIKFGTDGWRAVIANEFTFENVGIVVQAIAQYIHNHYGTDRPVVIGYDKRFQANHFSRHAAEILEKNGLRVLYGSRYLPTPVIAYAAMAYETAGALMFTASHNPPEYMGIKFIPEYAGPATTEITNELLGNIKNPASYTEKPGGHIEEFDPWECYVEYLSKTVNFDLIQKAPLKILYDAMYGVGEGHIDELLRGKGNCQVESIHTAHDPLFGGRMPEPKEEFLPELVKQTPAGGFDIGMANDGDADRFGLVDKNGRFYGSNEIMPLLLRYLHKKRGFQGSAVRTIATSMLMDRVTKEYGLTLHETPVGFKHVGEIMRKEPIIIGGEESCGISVLHHIPEKDGILALSLITEMIVAEGMPLNELYEDLLKEMNIRLHGISVNLHLPDEDKKRLMDEMRALNPGDEFAGRPIQSINTLDGVKLIFDQYDWVLLRPSGTEPILRLYGESPNPEFSQRFQQVIEDKIKQPCHA